MRFGSPLKLSINVGGDMSPSKNSMGSPTKMYKDEDLAHDSDTSSTKKLKKQRRKETRKLLRKSLVVKEKKMVDPFEYYFGKMDKKQNKEMDHIHFTINKKIDELKGKAPQLAK